MACIVATLSDTSSSRSTEIHLHRNQNVYFLTGSCNAPVISGQGLPVNAFPTYIHQHRDQWILYAGSNASVRLNGNIVVMERCELKDGDVLAVGESGSLLFLKRDGRSMAITA